MAIGLETLAPELLSGDTTVLRNAVPARLYELAVAQEGAIITSTIPRERVVQAQTPQGFRYELIQRAFASAAADGFMGTDEASLVERLGDSVWVVMGSPRNIKITTPADLELAEFLMAQAERGRNQAK